MITTVLLTIAPVYPDATAPKGPAGYIIGGIVALLILGYLIYSLLRPDKF